MARWTIRERRERCGNQTVLVGKLNRIYSDGSRETENQFLGVLKSVSYEDAKEICGVGGYSVSSIPLTPEQLDRLRYHDALRKLNFRISVLAEGVS